MRYWGKAVVAGALFVSALGIFGPAGSPASAHGSMDSPVSRVLSCYNEGPENPQSEACKAAVGLSGPQAFYDWNEVNIADAAGRHREIIPDGKLCSAGRDKYAGLDLARADWPSTSVSAGAQQLKFAATAPHRGSFELYITNDGYDPTQPLKWSDLESEPFATVTDPQAVDGYYTFDVQVPAKSGRHLIYAIWQRSDSPEAFYSCSDVEFGGASTAPPAAAPAAAPPDAGHADHGTEAAAPADGAEASGSASPDAADAPVAPAAPEDQAAPAQQPASNSEELPETGYSTPLAVLGLVLLGTGTIAAAIAWRRRAPWQRREEPLARLP